ncbi:putative C2H2 finger domain protein [Thermoascus aurantiacus ATCC 26904]
MAKEATQLRQSTEDTPSTQSRNPPPSFKHTRRSSSTSDPSTTSSAQVGASAASGSDPSVNMRRTSSVSDIPLPITYTPTTHRISKAKKGKRVHACEFPGCNKVFTRAEHRRRHELNHNPEASFRCTYEGCRRAFHRPDLLARHMERHELDEQTDDNAARRLRHQGQTSVASDPPNVISPVLVDTNTGSFPATRQQSTSMSINSIVAPGIHPDLAGDYSLTWSGTEIPLQPRAHMFPGYIRDSTDDSPFYSSPETCASPSSDGPSFQAPAQPRQSVSCAQTSMIEQYPKNIYSTDLTASPVQIHSPIRDWDPLEGNVPAPNVIPISLDGDVIQPVDSPVPIPLSNLDWDEWFALRRELGSAPGVISGNDGMEIMDTVKLQNCFECYWQYFHPLFPFPLMAGAMVAIGSQYDTRPNAKEYSLALLEACQKLLSKRIQITSCSRVTDIQTVFLLELLSKFGSRRADVQVSHRFRSLYGSFMHDHHWVSQNPLAVFNTLPPNPSHDALQKAHRFWVEHETRRRSALFGQPPESERSQQTIDLPFPCDSELWEAWRLEDWLRLARDFKPSSISSVAATLGTPDGLDTECLDSFQTTLVLAYSLSSGEVRDGQSVPRSSISFSPHSRTLLTHHALLATRHAPLQALLTVSGESWLFNGKLPQEEEFRKTKKAVWHVVRVLEQECCPMWEVNLSLAVRLGWRFPRDAGNGSNNSSNASYISPSPLTMLHANWALYTSALIRWAYGFDPYASEVSVSCSSTEFSQPQQQNCLNYNVRLGAFLSHVTIPPSVRCNTRPLLELVRTRLQEGRMGGLLNEGERVLARLAERRRGMWDF